MEPAWDLSALWWDWQQTLRSDPLVAPYYDTFVVLGGLALLLISVALLYHLAKYTAKAIAYLVRFVLWVSVGMLLLIGAILLALVVLPWAGRVTGASEVWPISHIYASLAERYNGNGARRNPDQVRSFDAVIEDDPEQPYAELEIDPVTGQRVRLPRVGDRVYRDHWDQLANTAADTFLGPEGKEWWYAWANGEWGTWAKLKIAGRITGNMALSLTKTAVTGIGQSVLGLFSRTSRSAPANSGSSSTGDDPFADVFAPEAV